MTKHVQGFTILAALALAFSFAGCREAVEPTGGVRDTAIGVPVAEVTGRDSAALLYAAGRASLERGDTTAALGALDQTMRWPLSASAPRAMYWKAFVLYRHGSSEALRTASNLLELSQQLDSRGFASGDGSILYLRVQARLAGLGDSVALKQLGVTSADLAKQCAQDAAAQLARAVDPGSSVAEHGERLTTLANYHGPCGAMIRQQALILSARLDSPVTVPALVRALVSDSSIQVRRAAVQLLPTPAPDVARAAIADVLATSRDATLLESAASAWNARKDWGTDQLKAFLRRPDANETAVSYVRRILSER